MIKDGDGNLPKPQVTNKTGFAAVVNSDGSVIVYYTNNDESAADTNENCGQKQNKSHITL